MELEDYIHRVKNPPKREVPVTFAAIDIDAFDEISSEKKRLFRAVPSQLSSNCFSDVYTEYQNKDSQFSYYQSQSDDGLRGLVAVQICEEVGPYDVLQQISKEKLDYEYGRCVKVGSQRYVHFDITSYKSMEESCLDRHFHAFFTEDGRVFINKASAFEIQKLTVDQLGTLLAHACIDKEEQTARKIEYRRAHQKH